MSASAGTAANMNSEDQRLLNAYIFDYLVKQSYGETARAFKKETDIPTISDEEARRRADSGDPANNTLGGALDANLQRQQKQEARTNGAADRPEPTSPASTHTKLDNADVDIHVEGGFLAEWWTIFWDMFAARQGRPSSGHATNFMAHNQRLKAERQSAAAATSLGQGNPAIPSAQQGQFVPIVRSGVTTNGMVVPPGSDVPGTPGAGDLVLNPNGPMNAKTREALMRQAMMNNGQRKATYPPTPGEIQRLKTQQYLQQQQLQSQQQQQQQQQQSQQQQSQQSQQQQQQMNREPSERLEGPSQSHPSPVVSAPSPSKRQRLSPDGAYAQVPGGLRPPQQQPQQQHMPLANGGQAQQAQQMLIKAGINPAGLSPQQLQAFQSQTPVMQQQQLSAYVQGLANQQQRAMQQAAKVPGGAQQQAGQMISASPVMQHAEGGGPPEGNHALQDYQMQLMLLEQQNKKRLLMARQEQERLQQPGENPAGVPFNNNSPQNRIPTSPLGRDVQRGTPKMSNQHGPGTPPDQGAAHQMQAQMQSQISRNASPAINFNPNHGPQATDPQHQQAQQQQAQQAQQQQMMYRQAMMQQQQENGGMPMMMGPQGPVMRPQMQFPPGHPAYNNPQVMQQMMQNQDPRARMFQQQMMQQQMQNGHMQRMTPQQQHQHAMAQHAHAQQQAQQAAQHHHAQQQQQQQAQQQQAQQQQAQHAQQQQQQQVQQGPPPHQQMPPPAAPAQPQMSRTIQQQGQQPPSPSLSNNQPPTPNQAHAKPPTRKTSTKENKKASAKSKKNGQPATPSTSEPPTPTTPATPLQGQAQFNHQPAHAPVPGPPIANEPVGFGAIEGGETSTGFTVGGFEGGGGDIDLSMMQDFDFDSFLQDEPGNMNMSFAGFGTDDA